MHILQSCPNLHDRPTVLLGSDAWCNKISALLVSIVRERLCTFAGSHATAVRRQVNSLCSQLSADAGRLALLLCEGFGIPDHLLQAPIAFNWQQIGTSWKHV